MAKFKRKKKTAKVAVSPEVSFTFMERNYSKEIIISMSFLPHAIVQLEIGFICDLELIVGGVPQASCLIVQGKEVMAQGRDC